MFPKITLKFSKAKKSSSSGTNSARSSLSAASLRTLVAIPVSKKIEVTEEDMLDWEDQAWTAPRSHGPSFPSFPSMPSLPSWSSLFKRRRHFSQVERW
ncbi:hypothetical protein M378DRAFT_154858 [Amanita muscaria Koide BX008]|uniref:Uncharacterized protein n=1 Tax=Amanita muscaria (strain Koide BX008) TaxID=946122 RepID=A0A0C2XQ39_AMAMK|nr:hypothetical protein M378DRAFT_154858 [Amanita muscaria Koide BX008]